MTPLLIALILASLLWAASLASQARVQCVRRSILAHQQAEELAALEQALDEARSGRRGSTAQASPNGGQGRPQGKPAAGV